MHMMFDSHLDLAWVALHYDRDLTQSVAELRTLEQIEQRHLDQPPTVSIPQMRDGAIHFCLATIFSRCRRPQIASEKPHRIPGHDAGSSVQAFAQGQAQIAWYHQLRRQNAIRLITTADALLDHALDRNDHRLGCLLMVEGADPITSPDQLSLWYDQGVRVISLVHTGCNTYAYGNGADGPVSEAGLALLDEMAAHRIVLDVSHLSPQSFIQAMDRFPGRVVATHSNCQHLVPGDRQLSDEQILAIVQRDGVVGMVAFNCFLDAGWPTNDTACPRLGLERMVDHIDHICQLTGNARHVGIGSDLDGGFGVNDVPAEIDTIADLWKIGGLLSNRGFSTEDIKAIFHANWIRVYHDALSDISSGG